MPALETAPMLTTAANIARPDDVYQLLIEAHAGLSDADSMKLNAKLVLILANHIGHSSIIEQAVALARASCPAKDTQP